MTKRELRIRRIGSFVAWLVGAAITYAIITYGSILLQISVLSAVIVYTLDDLWREWWRARCMRKAYERELREVDAQVRAFSAADVKAYVEGIMRRNVN